MLRISRIWHDPVWSKVIAGVILALLAAAWATGAHFGLWPQLLGTYPIRVWLLLLLVAVTLLSLVFLLSGRNTVLSAAKERNRPDLEPNITKIDVLTVPPDKGLTLSFPLKCYVQLRNDSALCADVGLLEYRPGTVTLKSFAVDALQLKLRNWVPVDHGLERIAVLPGQLFRAWIGADDSKFNAVQVNELRGRIGTLVFSVNGKRVDITL
jgi:hypothetical protein